MMAETMQALVVRAPMDFGIETVPKPSAPVPSAAYPSRLGPCPGVDMNLVHYNALHLIGATIFAPRHQHIALDLMASGRVPVDKLVTHRFPLSAFAEGARLALEGRALKVVMEPG